MAKTDFLHMRVDPELKEAVRREARCRHIDTSALVSLILGEWLTRNSKKHIDLSAERP